MNDYQRRDMSALVARLRKKILRLRESSARVGEENTKAALVEPLLSALGWDVEEPDEVHREYRKKPQDAPVDYALCLMRTPRLFVEAKSLEKSLEDRRWVSQILGYATVVGVEWCVLTNGDEYRLYNAHAAVDVEEKLFRRVTILDQASQALTEDTLGLLSKSSLSEKRLVLLWEAHHVDSQVKTVMERFWDKPDPAFLRLVRRNAKGLAPADIKASLQRCRIKVDFPIESAEVSPHAGRRPSRRRIAKGRRVTTVPGLPSQREAEEPLLQEILKRGGAIEMRTQFDEVANAVADRFSLSTAQRSARFSDGKTSVWKNRLQWVRQHLIAKGELDGSERGVWKVTPKGRGRLGSDGRRGLSLVDPA